MRRTNLCYFVALLASALALPAPAAAGDVALFTPETLTVSGDLRAGIAGGEKSWTTGGFGKLRDGGGKLYGPLGNADLVWQPRLGWLLSATVVATAQGGSRPEVGISEAFVTVRPGPSAGLRPSLKAGLIWVPISLEHTGADWHVRDTITPSAINSWVGEELLPLTVQGSLAGKFGGHRVTLTAAGIAANDTAGALLTYRGWALHDRRTLAGRAQPLPPLNDEIEDYQPHYTHPLLDVGPGFAKRPGYYVKLAWEPPFPVQFELLRYDNNGDPAAANPDREWAWRTQFDHLGVTAQLSPSTRLTAQAISGRTRMGLTDPAPIWIDMRFRSAFALLSQKRGPWTLAARGEAFGTRQRGSYLTHEDSEQGWAATAAVKRTLTPQLTAAVELLHVSSRREARVRLGEAPRQDQTQLQMQLRASW